MNHRPIESEVMTAELRVREPLVKRGEPPVAVIPTAPQSSFWLTRTVFGFVKRFRHEGNVS